MFSDTIHKQQTAGPSALSAALAMVVHSQEVVSHMTISQFKCLVAFLSQSTKVVGGCVACDKTTNFVEIVDKVVLHLRL